MIFPDPHQENESIDFNYLDEDFPKVPTGTSAMLQKILEDEQQMLTQLTFIFCDDDYLLALNKQFLEHDTLTDIITFPMSNDGIDGEIYISIPRVEENAKSFETPFEKEYLRVLAHGVLHLCGYGDKSEEEIKVMRSKEDHYIAFAEN